MSKAICSIRGCDRFARARGWCSLHWQRWSNTGDPLGLRPRIMKPRSWCVASCADCADWIATKAFGRAAKKRCDLCQRAFERLMAPTHKVGENPNPCSECGDKIGSKGGRGMCGACLQRSRRLALKAAGGKACAVEGCVNRGWQPGDPYCDMHRSRLRTTGELGDPGRKTVDRIAANPDYITQKKVPAVRAKLLYEQGGLCAVCRTDDPIRWHLDHDQSCCPAGRFCWRCVRGVLCHTCNVGIVAILDRESESALRWLADGPSGSGIATAARYVLACRQRRLVGVAA